MQTLAGFGGSRDATEILARAGYAARGVVYLLVGGLATLAALGRGGQTSGSRDALKTLLDEPLGEAMLIVIALGLVCYSIWRSIQAIQDPDHHGTDAKGLAIRIGLGVSAVTHVLLAFFAASLVFTLGGSGGGESGDGSKGITAWLMQQPYGTVLVGAVGLAIVGAGVAHAIKGWKAEFSKYMQMPSDTRRWAYPVCRFGLIIRGIVLVIIGGFFLVTAYQFDPSEAGGLAEVFDAVRGQTYGAVLLLVVAVGLAAFGVYSIIESIYRRIDVPR